MGAVLQAWSGIAVAGIGLARLDLLSRSNNRVAIGYLALRCVEAVVIVAAGAYLLGSRTLVADYELAICAFTGAGGLMLCYLLNVSRLVPTWLSWPGIVGYVATLVAIPSTALNIAALDSGIGILLYVPGGLFEIILPMLLIARGFRATD